MRISDWSSDVCSSDLTGAPSPESAVVSVVLGDPQRAFDAASACRDPGLHVGCFRPPSVPEGTSRLRLTARATLSASEMEQIALVLRGVLAGARAGAFSW